MLSAVVAITLVGQTLVPTYGAPEEVGEPPTLSTGDRAAQLLVESLGGIGGGLAGGFVGAVTLYSLGSNSCSGDGCYIGQFFAGYAGAMLGATVGAPLGTWAAEESVGDNGSLASAFAGGGIGLVSSVALLGTAGAVNPFVWLAVPLCPIAGAITGYALSSTTPALPSAWVTDDGAGIGVSGMF